MNNAKDEKRAAYERRRDERLAKVTASMPTEPTDAAARQEAEFEKRRGEALAASRRRARLMPHKLTLVKILGGAS